VVLSLAAPLIKINIGHTNTTESYNVLKILNTVTIDEGVIVESNKSGLFSLTAEQALMLGYVLILALLFFYGRRKRCPHFQDTPLVSEN
jgi:hypothetical protein